MNDENIAERLLRSMGQLEPTQRSTGEQALELARMTRVVETTLGRARAEQRARRRRWLSAAMLAAAIGVAVAVSLRPWEAWRSERPASLVARAGIVRVLSANGSRSEAVSDGMLLEPGAELATLETASAAVELVSGAVVRVQAATRVRLPTDGGATRAERLELFEGTIALTVPHLAPGRTLSVVTPNATVTVRGTRFSVTVSPTAAGASTSVAVDEGRVEVRTGERAIFLERGGHWSSSPPPPAIPASAAARSEAGEAVLPPSKAVVQALPRQPPATAQLADERSSLAEENALFEQALKKARHGELDAALVDLERFLRDHARSPLTQAVRVEHFKLLRDSGQKVRAATEARRYLSDYPNGFAREDARRTVLPEDEAAP